MVGTPLFGTLRPIKFTPALRTCGARFRAACEEQDNHVSLADYTDVACNESLTCDGSEGWCAVMGAQSLNCSL
jgi:hypothetical protein